MPKITFISADEKSMAIEIPIGWSLMEGAVKANVPGIDADCGGACACATCHVYVDPAWMAKLPPKKDMEDTMLDFAPVTTPNSRLSCQIKVTAEMEGLVLRVPFSQH